MNWNFFLWIFFYATSASLNVDIRIWNFVPMQFDISVITLQFVHFWSIVCCRVCRLLCRIHLTIDKSMYWWSGLMTVWTIFFRSKVNAFFMRSSSVCHFTRLNCRYIELVLLRALETFLHNSISFVWLFVCRVTSSNRQSERENQTKKLISKANDFCCSWFLVSFYFFSSLIVCFLLSFLCCRNAIKWNRLFVNFLSILSRSNRKYNLYF